MAAFGTLVTDVGMVPFCPEALYNSSMGIMKEINREYRLMDVSISPNEVKMRKGRIKKLRAIRKDIKKHLKTSWIIQGCS